MAGQHATAFASGKTGLSLGGSGTLAPIEQGKPRAPSIERVPVPRNGSLGASQRGQRTKHPTGPAGERSRRPARCCSHIVADRRSAVKRPPRDERSRSQQFGGTWRRAERHQQGHHLAIAQLVGRRKQPAKAVPPGAPLTRPLRTEVQPQLRLLAAMGTTEMGTTEMATAEAMAIMATGTATAEPTATARATMVTEMATVEETVTATAAMATG